MPTPHLREAALYAVCCTFLVFRPACLEGARTPVVDGSRYRIISMHVVSSHMVVSRRSDPTTPDLKVLTFTVTVRGASAAGRAVRVQS